MYSKCDCMADPDSWFAFQILIGELGKTTGMF